MTITPAPSLSFDQAFKVSAPTVTASIEPKTTVLLCLGTMVFGIVVGYFIVQAQSGRNMRLKKDPAEVISI